VLVREVILGLGEVRFELDALFKELTGLEVAVSFDRGAEYDVPVFFRESLN
jgi:hypothetical protein